MSVSIENHNEARMADQFQSGVRAFAPSVDALLSQAVKEYQAGHLPSARALSYQILALDVAHPEANHLLGVLAIAMNQIEFSLRFFKTALDSNPDEAMYWVSYVDALVQANHIADARMFLMQGLALGLHGAEVDVLVNNIIKAQHAKSEEALTSKDAQVLPKQVMHTEPPISANVKQALVLLKAGKLKEAKAKFEKLLKNYPKNPHVLTGMGTVSLQQGQIAEGVRWLEQCLSIHTDFVLALNHLAIAYVAQQRCEDAVSLCSRAIALAPQDKNAYVNRANALRQLGRMDDAITDYSQAINLNPRDADSHFNLGSIYKVQGQHQDAVTSFLRASELNPRDAESHQQAGTMLWQLKRYVDAKQYYSKAIAINKQDSASFYGRGLVNLELACFTEAAADFERVIALTPEKLNAYLNLGVVLQRQGAFELARSQFDHVIQTDKTFAKAYNNRGLLNVETLNLDAAAKDYEMALTLDPHTPEVKWNKALLALLAGDFKLGWQFYEYRWDSILKEFKRHFPQPLWLGAQTIVGKSLLVYPEQGLGDFIQFCRYIPVLKQMGVHVILQVPKPLFRLMSCLETDCSIIEDGVVLPDFDYHCPIMSLPLALKTTLDAIPPTVSYLAVNQTIQAEWKAKLGNKTKPRVGLVWSGSTAHKNDHNRSIPFKLLSSLLALPIEFHVLQKEIRVEDEKQLKQTSQVLTHRTSLTDFADTAALIEEMDLVISVDTSVAHLAAALGKECWILLPYSPDFRWMLNRKDSPWYPTATLYRQPMFNDWQAVLSEVQQQIELRFSL